MTIWIAIWLWCVAPAWAQFNQGGFGGGGNRGGGFGGGGGSAQTSRQYFSNGMIGDAMVTSDPESRRIIVITDEETGKYISQVITNLDRPKPQVLIKVVFLQVEHNNSSDIGFDGTHSRAFGNSYTSVINQVFGLAGASRAFPSGAGLYQVMGSDFQATLRAIASAGKTEVLSRPTILARHNQQASITVGQRVPLITGTRFDNFGNQINTLSYTDVGIILQVTPFITPDGLVEMIVSPQISSLSDRTVSISSGGTNGAGTGAPIIDIRSADTVVVTPDGQPIVIGGLIQNQKQESEGKIPLLGDIPLLGAVFKRKTKQNVKTELMIFLTPYVVREPSQLAGITASERGNQKLVPKAFTEQELNQFLDTLPAQGAPAPKESPPKPAPPEEAPKNSPATGVHRGPN